MLIILCAVCFCLVGCTPDGEASDGKVSGGETDAGVTHMYLTVNGNKLAVKLENNKATAALVELLQQGDIVYTADDYGGFEKVGAPGLSLPTSDVRITTSPGDVILYNGNNIVLFYGSNTWSYTRLGRIEGYSAAELAEFFGKGSVQVTVSLE